jgi:outer membrane receptor protein involved in Fe transport
MLFDGRLEATLGLRHFHDDISQVGQFGAGTPLLPASSTAEANTPRAVLTWHPATNVLAYASYQQGFRSGFPQDPTVPAGFAGVRPDRLRNYELGSKGTFMDTRLGYDVSVYYMKWQGIQQSLTVPYQDVTTQAIVNGEGASGIGTDVALSVEPLRNLKLQVSASWNNLAFDRDVVSGGLVLFRKGERTTSSPELTGQFSAQYTFPIGAEGYRGMIDASVAYTSSQAYRGFVGSTLSDLEVDRGDPMTLAQIRLALLTPTRFTPSLFIDNLTNERGAPVRAFVGVRNWDARVRPRTVGVQLEYTLR